MCRGAWERSPGLRSRTDSVPRSPLISNVSGWFAKNVPRTKEMRGQSSLIARKPRQEYQIDLFFFADLQREKKQKW